MTMLLLKRPLWIAGGILAGGLFLALLLSLEQGRAPWFVLFAGRFHPTIVHFPIALLLIAAAIELLAPRSGHLAQVRPAVPFLLVLGAVTALASVVLGYLLSLSGGYEERLLSQHMWLGIAVTVVAMGLAVASMRNVRPGKIYRGILAGMAVLVLVGGHLGGSLSRGSGYLTYYIPQPIKLLMWMDAGEPAGLIADIDSALVFGDLVQPILQARCVGCHGPNKSKGNLRLDSRDGIEKGGRDAPAFVAGNPSQSEIVRRITLPPHDEDAMPPDGERPLDVGETELFRWWIAHGASFEQRVAEIDETPTAVTTYLARVSKPRAPRQSGIYALDVAPAADDDVAALAEQGLIVSRIDPQAPFLTVSATRVRDGFGDEELEALRTVAAQIARLDVGHSKITDLGAAVLAEMPHLTHLHLERTLVGDAALQKLAGLRYLEYLNLYGTTVTDAGLEHLRTLPALRSVYLWQTAVTEEAADRFRGAAPGTEVNTGSGLDPALSDDAGEGS